MMSLAPPSYGKSQAQKALEKIAGVAEITNLFAAIPTSDSALVNGLAAQPRQLILWDEFGEAMEDLAHARNSPKATILSAMMIAFSVAGGTFRGKQYADGRTTVSEGGYLNLFGVSNEFSFFNALTDRFVHNGFLARWLCFAPDVGAYAEPQKRASLEISTDALDWIRAIDGGEASRRGNLGRLFHKEKRVIDLSRSLVWEVFAEQLDYAAEHAKSEFDRIFWGRSAELYSKLCLVFLDEPSDEQTLDTKSPTYWAYDLVSYLIKEQIERCREKLSGTSEKERAKDRYMGLIAKGEEITRTELADRARRSALSTSEKKDLFEVMTHVGRWVVESRHTKEGDRKKTQYVRCKR
jgi:hypothetical protein